MGLEDLVAEYLAALDAFRVLEAAKVFDSTPTMTIVHAKARLDNAERDMRAYIA